MTDRTMKPKSKPVHPEVRIGHVHLKVADLDRALAFYRDVLGFELTQRYGSQAAFLSAGGYHHHIGLNTWESQGGSPPHRGATGLYHVAIVYPTRAELADALRRLIQRSEEHTSELQSHSDLVCRLLLEKKNTNTLMSILVSRIVQ